ncbi:unnamed protein product [Brachionus calyciflorus]|uniref:BEN domain-containing protein n=1 Tax=Brachionus calyciflorus TaxID=104777 RepID=A0A814DX39_9BILA|nr:unnamed protein product [Brachionus calyciflorus]
MGRPRKIQSNFVIKSTGEAEASISKICSGPYGVESMRRPSVVSDSDVNKSNSKLTVMANFGIANSNSGMDNYGTDSRSLDIVDTIKKKHERLFDSDDEVVILKDKNKFDCDDELPSINFKTEPIEKQNFKKMKTNEDQVFEKYYDTFKDRYVEKLQEINTSILNEKSKNVEKEHDGSFEIIDSCQSDESNESDSSDTDDDVTPLSYSEIPTIYLRSKSIPNFALSLILRLFKKSELSSKYNVNGKTIANYKKKPLDPKRIDDIRSIVFDKMEGDKDSKKKTIEELHQRYEQKN